MKFTSRVISGRKHGRAIGYPTANLEITDAVRRDLDKEGVYAVRVKIGDSEHAGALFYGKRALFGDSEPVCEVLLLNFDGDLYGEEIKVEVIKYLRAPVEVKDEEELRQLIEKDISNLKNVTPERSEVSRG